MIFALVAVLSGAALYAACVAAVALQAGGASALWWLAVAAVALCHAGSGLLAMSARAAGQGFASATSPAISLGITGIVLAAALLLVFRFPIHVSQEAAMLLLGACVVVGAMVLAVAYSRRIADPGARRPGRRH